MRGCSTEDREPLVSPPFASGNSSGEGPGDGGYFRSAPGVVRPSTLMPFGNGGTGVVDRVGVFTVGIRLGCREVSKVREAAPLVLMTMGEFERDEAGVGIPGVD